MSQVPLLPTIDACLNFVALVLLTLGYIKIRAKNIQAHRRYMIAAFAVSMAFLVVYLTYHLTAEEKKFAGQGFIRPVYFVILITHIALAATVPFLASITLYLGLRDRRERHRRIARITLPIWMYVSVTGVIVYVMLYPLESFFSKSG